MEEIQICLNRTKFVHSANSRFWITRAEWFLLTWGLVSYGLFTGNVEIRRYPVQITIEYLDGTSGTFPETSRTGGSYCTTGKAEMGWYIVSDAYGNQTKIPADRIKAVRTSGGRW